MNDVKLYEICDDKHILIVNYQDDIFYYEILDDLKLKFIDSIYFFKNIIEILKHSNNIFLLISPKQIETFSIYYDYISDDSHMSIKANEYTFDKAINLPNGKISVTTKESFILIYNILPDNIILELKIDTELDSPLSLYYIQKTNELLISSFDEIIFMNIKKYTFDYIIKKYNYYIWHNQYNNYLGKHSMENDFCMINDNILAISFSKNVITLIDINKHEIINNFIDSHNNITSLIKPNKFLDNNFLCSIYDYDCHGGQYYYLSKAKIIFYISNNDKLSFDVDYSNKIKIDTFPISIKLLRDNIILMLCLNDQHFGLKIFKYDY